MKAGQVSRGQPLVALAALLGGWVIMRAMLWDAAAFAPVFPEEPEAERRSGGGALADLHDSPLARDRHSQGQLPPARAAERFRPVPAAAVADRPAALRQSFASPGVPAPSPVPPPQVRTVAAHPMLWMAVLSRVPLPVSLLAAPPVSPPAPFHPVGHEPLQGRRWSTDGWLLLRRGGKVSLATGAAPSTYGASQAGAVLRYRLSPQSRHRPAAYLRASAALNGSREKEAAIGLSARPFAALPVTAAVELRATDRQGGTRVRPAVMAVSELAPFDLPFEARGEAYGQAGYVGGKFSTGFVDGQLRIDRRVARFGPGELRAGAGAWGGAQKGASRLDIGPVATVGLGIGANGWARLGADWRFRVAGDAAPASGPALTLSAGF